MPTIPACPTPVGGAAHHGNCKSNQIFAGDSCVVLVTMMNIFRTSFMCASCPQVKHKLCELVAAGEQPVGEAFPNHSWRLMKGRDGTVATGQALKVVLDVLQESFDPIISQVRVSAHNHSLGNRSLLAAALSLLFLCWSPQRMSSCHVIFQFCCSCPHIPPCHFLWCSCGRCVPIVIDCFLAHASKASLG